MEDKEKDDGTLRILLEFFLKINTKVVICILNVCVDNNDLAKEASFTSVRKRSLVITHALEFCSDEYSN